MRNLIGYCGLDCEKCDAYIATLSNDQQLREKTAKLWSKLNQYPITPEQINCQGCRVDGIKTIFCDSLCEIRKCAMNKQMETCGACMEMEQCPKLGIMVSNNPDLLNNLNEKKANKRETENEKDRDYR